MTSNKEQIGVIEAIPCNWCGIAPVVVKGAGYNYSVECQTETCIVQPCTVGIRGRDNAITAWNTRASNERSALLNEVREVLEAVIHEHDDPMSDYGCTTHTTERVRELYAKYLNPSAGRSVVSNTREIAERIVAEYLAKPDRSVLRKLRYVELTNAIDQALRQREQDVVVEFMKIGLQFKTANVRRIDLLNALQETGRAMTSPAAIRRSNTEGEREDGSK